MEPEQPMKPGEILNAADYVDALLRPKSDRYAVTHEKIKGRRFRDQYLEEVTLIKAAEPQT